MLTSAASRAVGKAVSERTLDFPPKLPARADPKSEEARIFGPLSKRRETNTRWRYFVEQWQNVRPPLEVTVENIPAGTSGAALDDVRRIGIRGLPMQGLHVFEDVETLATPLQKGPRRPPRNSNSASTEPHIPRWIRRRYQELLNHIPTLTYKIPTHKNPPRYVAGLAANANNQLTKIVDADVADVEWLEERIPRS